tara:strand:- start:38 stop:514 length:477 start_codon:yes stop_codon:yes gene_type:complete
MGQNSYTLFIQQEPDSMSFIQQKHDIWDQQMIASYNEAFPLNTIRTMNELPIPNNTVCKSITNGIELKKAKGTNPLQIFDVETFMLPFTLQTLLLKLVMVEDGMFDTMINEMNISELLIELGIEKKHTWYFWQFDAIKEKVIVDGQEMYLYQLSAYQL